MILILEDGVRPRTETFEQLLQFVRGYAGVSARVHEVRGVEKTVTEIYLIGDTKSLDAEEIAELPGVERVVRVSREYRILGRHAADDEARTGELQVEHHTPPLASVQIRPPLACRTWPVV